MRAAAHVINAWPRPPRAYMSHYIAAMTEDEHYRADTACSGESFLLGRRAAGARFSHFLFMSALPSLLLSRPLAAFLSHFTSTFQHARSSHFLAILPSPMGEIFSAIAQPAGAFEFTPAPGAGELRIKPAKFEASQACHMLGFRHFDMLIIGFSTAFTRRSYYRAVASPDAPAPHTSRDAISHASHRRKGCLASMYNRAKR